MERRVLTLIALFAAAALLTLKLEMGKEGFVPPTPLPFLPAHARDWQGIRLSLSRDELEILGADNVEAMQYYNSAGEGVGLYIVRERRKRGSFHPPEYCYLAQSNVSITGKGRAPISLNGGRIEASTMTLQTEKGGLLVLYWYKSGSYRTPSYYKHQLSFLWRMFRQGGSDSAMVRLTARVGDDGVNGALKRIEDLLADLAPHYDI